MIAGADVLAKSATEGRRARSRASSRRGPILLVAALLLGLWSTLVSAEDAAQADPPPPADYDADLAGKLGADAYGMRKYVLVILKSSATPVPEGDARKAMFAGHFANMKRLAEEGKLVLAGPLDGVDGWRGLFVYAVEDIEEAKQLTATDPVISEGEMVAEYHNWYGSAGVMMISEIHARLAKSAF